MTIGRFRSLSIPYYIVLGLIILFALFLRTYRMGELAVFLADQASDSTKVLEMTRGHLTLLGPITSVGGFYNGPIVYYLMFPFYFILKASPLSGTIFQTFFSVFTIPILYLIGKRVKNEKVGIIASFLFAISPLVIDYSRAAFNSYPAIFFSTLILYLFLRRIDKPSIIISLILGILLGFVIQMHYLTVSLNILALFSPLFLFKNLKSFKRYYIPLCAGIILGLSPFIFFEVRHNFLNFHLFLTYLSQQNATPRSLSYGIGIWPEVVGKLLFGESIFFGGLALILGGIFLAYLYTYEKIEKKYLKVFGFLFVTVLGIGILYGHPMHDHYIISFHTSLIFLSALALYYFSEEEHIPVILVCILLLFVNMTHWNLDKPVHPLQDGLSIADFQKAATIIHTDTKGTFNVAMHAQGDNRAMPLRYMLNLQNDLPHDYTDYGDVDTLYFIARTTDPLSNQTMWEYTSFGESKEIEQWRINNNYILYKLIKADTPSID